MDYQLKWFKPGEQRYVKGYLNGRRQPSMLMHLTPSPELLAFFANETTQAPQLFQQIQQWWQTHLHREFPTTRQVHDWQTLLLLLSDCTEHLLSYLGYRILPHNDHTKQPPQAQLTQAESTVLVSVPHCSPQLVARAWSVVVMVAELHLREKHRQTNDNIPAEDWLMKVLTPLREPMKEGIHENFSSAAYELDIPMYPLHGRLTQFGQGHRSQWLEHSFTEQTSVLPVRAARHKWYANRLLRRAGLPVPPQFAVKDQAEACTVAKRIGYPVVVKPADLDGGVGVAAHLSNEAELIEAYKSAREHSQNIVVEQHVEGRDYRIQVQDNEVVFAVERVPAGVIGDGQHTIEQLTAIENNHERRREGPKKNLATLKLDDEALKLLQTQQMTKASIPQQGQFVMFRRIANMSAGGRPVPALDNMHEDNKRLAIRATQALRLDVAGVDLIIPDIRVSWLESGAAICEVNACPDLGHTAGLLLYRNLLRNRLEGNGRIPVYVVIDQADPDAPSTLLQQTVAKLNQQGLTVGWSDHHGVSVNQETLTHGQQHFATAFNMLNSQQNVAAMVLRLNDPSVLERGLPMDRIDEVLCATEADRATALYELAEQQVI
ncbi:ATP-binding protein [Pseudidiomarina homiensis]|uniref:ATP-binding protein n=1 Tax=Pseudidiomarina homiensis TaxID=364198 RepID=UPI00215A3240|nr:acetate--CoA ligase family protein [Pseudidiomarina homiensis]